MAIVKSDYANGRKAMPAPVGSEVVNVLISMEVTAAQTASGDLWHMGDLPENCALVDAVYAADDLDSNGAPALVTSFGVINDGETDLTSAIQAGLTIGQAAGAARLTPDITTLTTVTTGSARKKLGYKVTTAAATGAAGTVYLSLSYRNAAYGE